MDKNATLTLTAALGAAALFLLNRKSNVPTTYVQPYGPTQTTPPVYQPPYGPTPYTPANNTSDYQPPAPYVTTYVPPSTYSPAPPSYTAHYYQPYTQPTEPLPAPLPAFPQLAPPIPVPVPSHEPQSAIPKPWQNPQTFAYTGYNPASPLPTSAAPQAGYGPGSPYQVYNAIYQNVMNDVPALTTLSTNVPNVIGAGPPAQPIPPPIVPPQTPAFQLPSGFSIPQITLPAGFAAMLAHQYAGNYAANYGGGGSSAAASSGGTSASSSGGFADSLAQSYAANYGMGYGANYEGGGGWKLMDF